MGNISPVRSGDRAFLLAAVTAAMAAIFMVTIWAPLQLRAFAHATDLGQPEALTTDNEAWLRIPFVTADGKATSLAGSNGRIRVVTMMYTHCPGACPLAISTLQQLQGRLSLPQQKQLSIVALSLDPERDSIAQLQEFRNARRIDPSRWVVGRASTEGVRQLAGVLGVSYRVLNDESVDHQSAFVLIDKAGHILARSYNTRSVDPAFLGALQAALNPHQQ